MKNLEQKITLLVQDIARMNDFDKARAIKNFVESEIVYTQSEHAIGIHDLANIHSYAAKLSTDLSPHLEIDGSRIVSNSVYTQALCYSEAFYMWLRSNDYIKVNIGFRGKK